MPKTSIFTLECFSPVLSYNWLPPGYCALYLPFFGVQEGIPRTCPPCNHFIKARRTLYPYYCAHREQSCIMRTMSKSTDWQFSHLPKNARKGLKLPFKISNDFSLTAVPQLPFSIFLCCVTALFGWIGRIRCRKLTLIALSYLKMA